MLQSNLKLLEEKNPLLALRAQMAPEKEPVDVTYVFGLGEIPLQGKRVIFFEDDGERVRRFLQTASAEHLLADPRVSIVGTDVESLKKVLWETALDTWELISLRAEGFLPFEEQLTFLKEGILLIVNDVKDGGRRVLFNILQNSTLSLQDGLRLTMPGIPAIVCGAGPSLDRHRAFIRASKGKALIIACGSASELVEEADCVAMLDPLQAQTGGEKPLFFQNRLNAHFLKTWSGPKLNMGHSGGFPVEEYLFGPGRFLDSGWNAGNFGVAIAKALGCDPIIPIGIDSAGGYAEGIERKKNSADFAMARAWMAEQGLSSIEETKLIKDVELTFAAPPLPLYGQSQAFYESLKRCAKHVAVLVQHSHPLHEVELEEEVAYRYFLAPLWEIWQYLAQEKMLFFQGVLEGL